jgi:hypothetical protein
LCSWFARREQSDTADANASNDDDHTQPASWTTTKSCVCVRVHVRLTVPKNRSFQNVVPLLQSGHEHVTSQERNWNRPSFGVS